MKKRAKRVIKAAFIILFGGWLIVGSNLVLLLPDTATFDDSKVTLLSPPDTAKFNDAVPTVLLDKTTPKGDATTDAAVPKEWTPGWSLAPDSNTIIPTHPDTGTSLMQSCTMPTKAFYSNAKSLVSDYYRSLTKKQKPEFEIIGQKLLKAAAGQNETLLTFQIGGMDGIRGDPLHKMFKSVKDGTVRNWMPVVAEPTPASFGMLVKTYYDRWILKGGVPCPLVLNRAISYADSQPPYGGDCSFCHFNATPNPVCDKKPDYMKHEINTLDCETLRNHIGAVCTTEVKIPCGTVGEGLALWGLAAGGTSGEGRGDSATTDRASWAPISLLQVDAEGYEAQLIPGILRELKSLGPNYVLPVINFESKIIRRRGHLDAVLVELKESGYKVFTGRVDTIAILVDDDEEGVKKG